MNLHRNGDFDHRDIRISMDVWTADNGYLGTVRRVLGEGVGVAAHVDAPDRREEDGRGEALGPMPTQSLGNTGPVAQSTHAAYATNDDGAEFLGTGMMTVGHWAGLIGRRTIALDHVQSVSLERVTLRVTKADLDEPPRRK